MYSVYIDNSGSMGEMDKISVAVYIARSIKNAKFYLLNGRQINLDSIPPLDNNKSLYIQSNDTKILLSDGLFDGGEKIFDIALSIGIDADIKVLNEMAKLVYEMDDILVFLDCVNLNNGSDSWD